MKILAFTDMHGSMKAFNAIKKKSKKAELILCCGDFTIFEIEIEEIIKKLDSLEKPMLIIPGNHEKDSTVEKLCKRTNNLHYINGTYYEDNNILVFGAEGNGFSIRDKHFEKMAKKFKRVHKRNKNKPYILITHAPPYGTRHDLLIDEHCGNKTIRDFIKDTQPLYAFCGHIHENSYTKDTIEDTTTINPGPKGKIIEV
ncbi:MAG: metallophosphoesterase family protein [Nanobdellota archaeon]